MENACKLRRRSCKELGSDDESEMDSDDGTELDSDDYDGNIESDSGETVIGDAYFILGAISTNKHVK